MSHNDPGMDWWDAQDVMYEIRKRNPKFTDEHKYPEPYVPSHLTNLQKKFERVIRKMKQAQEPDVWDE